MKRKQKLFSPNPEDQATGGHSENQVPASNAASSPAGHTQPDWLKFIICFFLAAMVWAVFGQTRHFDFTNFDDPTYVYNNPVFNQGLNWHAIVWSFTHENEHEWFPVTYVTRMLDFQLYGSNAGGHHVTNVLLHAATAICLFLVLQRMTGKIWPPAFVAAAFAIHPLRVESVAWVVERKDVLSGLFFMLTLWTWMDYVQNRPAVQKTGRPQQSANSMAVPRHYLFSYFLALFFFALGLLSKSMLVTLPCVMLLLDYWPLKRLPPGGFAPGRPGFRAGLGLILEKIPFLLLSAAACVTTALTEKNVMSAAHHHSIYWRIGNVLLAYADYLKHTVYPAGLAVVYPYSETSPSIVSVGLSALILFLISVLAVAGRRRHPCLLVGWLWFLGMLLPVIDSMQSTQNARADRYTYLPQIGLLIAITWGAVEFGAARRRGPAVLACAAVAILASLLVVSHIQTACWKDSVTLWTRALACTSGNYFAENSLGSALNNQGKWAEAAGHFEQAIQFKPDYIEAHVNLGVALASQGKPQEAISQFEQALQLNPNSAEAHYHLGDALAGQDKPEAAIGHFQQALQLKPDYTDAHYDLGLALAGQKQWSNALPHLEQALHLKLDETDVKYILAVRHAAQKKWNEAIELYQQVLQRKPDFAEAHNNLGIALDSTGKSIEAAQQFQQALALATAQGNSALAESVRTRLESDQPGLPHPQKP